MKNNIARLRHNKIIRYAIGGGSAALLDLFLLWLCTDIVGIYYITSQILAFIGSFTYGFFYQKYITFRDYSKKHTGQMGRFFMFQIIGLGMGLLILNISVEYWGLHYLIGSAIAKLIVFGRNYIMNNMFNFSAKEGK